MIGLESGQFKMTFSNNLGKVFFGRFLAGFNVINFIQFVHFVNRITERLHHVGHGVNVMLHICLCDFGLKNLKRLWCHEVTGYECFILGGIRLVSERAPN